MGEELDMDDFGDFGGDGGERRLCVLKMSRAEVSLSIYSYPN